MELRINKEGIQYVLGLTIKNNSSLFSQIILSAGELEWLESEVTVTGFSSLDDARRAHEELQVRLDRPICIYKVDTERVQTGPTEGNKEISGLTK